MAIAYAAVSQLFLFGGDKPWSSQDWTAQDDRVRGGSSHSELAINPPSPIAVFRGNLDTTTLGGAGFASQRTTGENRTWDLSDYDGLLLDTVQSDGKQYTLTIKDELLSQRPDGRDQSTVSWEYDFTPNTGGEKVFAKWDDFKATYRGREKPDAKPLDLKNVKRISLMMRSFFDKQSGDFSLSLISIAAAKASDSGFIPYKDEPSDTPTRSNEKIQIETRTPKQSWLGRLLGLCGL